MTETPVSTDEEDHPAEVTLDGFVGRQASRLCRGYLADRADAVAELARLRRTLPRRGEIAPDTWVTFERGFPPSLAGSGDAPSPPELAAAAALALVALHQQSRRDTAMHARGRDHVLGRAAHLLRSRVDSQGVERRVQALARSNRFDPLLEHLRALVTQLRAERIPLDYAQLALDLAAAQHPDGLRRVRTRWLRDFYRFRGKTPDDGTDDDTDSTPQETA